MAFSSFHPLEETGIVIEPISEWDVSYNPRIDADKLKSDHVKRGNSTKTSADLDQSLIKQRTAKIQEKNTINKRYRRSPHDNGLVLFFFAILFFLVALLPSSILLYPWRFLKMADIIKSLVISSSNKK